MPMHLHNLEMKIQVKPGFCLFGFFLHQNVLIVYHFWIVIYSILVICIEIAYRKESNFDFY